MGQVVDHIVAMDHTFPSAKHKLFPVQKREVFVEPLQFFGEGVGKFHGGGYDKHLVFFMEFFHYFLRIFVHAHGAEKTLLKNITG